MTRLTDAAAQAAIGAATRELHLPTVRDRGRPGWPRSPPGSTPPTWPTWPRSWPPRLDDRAERAAPAASPRPASPASSAWPTSTWRRPDHQPGQLATLATGAYLDAGEPVVLLGDSGTGKSHLLIGLGVAACEQGRRVRYVTSAQLVNELAEAADERACPASSAATAASTCCCSTSSATSKSTPAAPNCCSRSSPNAKNGPPSRSPPTCPSANGATVFTDPRLVAAIVDRVTFNAHILETGTQSYRLRTSKTTSRSRKPS